MIKIARYFAILLLAVFVSAVGGVVTAATESETISSPHQAIQDIPTFQEWRLRLVADAPGDVKACKKTCKAKGTTCKRKCYGTADDLACKAECTAVRAVCYKVCKGEKPKPPQ
ncbi:MAG: hypothetical protein ACE5G9_03570 [Nitrospinales bacterium]